MFCSQDPVAPLESRLFLQLTVRALQPIQSSIQSDGQQLVLSVFFQYYREFIFLSNLQNSMRFCFADTLSNVLFFSLVPCFHTFQQILRVSQILISLDRIFFLSWTISFNLSCILKSSLRKLSSFLSVSAVACVVFACVSSSRGCT